MKNKLLLIFIFFGTILSMVQAAETLTQQTTQPEILTLESALKMMDTHNRLLAISAAEIEKSDAQERAFKTLRYPQFNIYALGAMELTPVNFFFREGSLGTYPGLGAIPGTDTNIHSPQRPYLFTLFKVDQPLSQLYRIGLGVEIYRMAKQITQEKYRQDKQEARNQVRKLYYGILQTESTLTALEESKRYYEELDSYVTRNIQEKTVLPADSMDVKTAIARDNYSMQTTQNLLITYKQQMNDLLGRDIHTEFTVQPVTTLAPLEDNLNNARDTALLKRPEIRESQLKTKQAELDIKIKKNEKLPDISLSISNINIQKLDIIPQNIASAGVLFTWDAIDWGKKDQVVRERENTYQQAMLAAKETETRIIIDVEDRYRKLQESRSLLELASKNKEAMIEKLRVTQNKYTQQAVLLKDVLQAQSNLAEAQSKYQQALLYSWTAQADWIKALGLDETEESR